jgi:hypothetical protein
MGFFSRFRLQPEQPKVDGLLGYYGLADWWLTTFTPAEREHIEATYQPMGMRPGSHPLTQGKRASSQTATDFLSGLASWFRKADDASIAVRIRAKMDELALTHPVTDPGYYGGRHNSTYGDDVTALKRSGDSVTLEQLLLGLVDATEAESRAKGSGWGVTPGWYQELAVLYRGRKDYVAEVAILERFKQQPHAPGVLPPRLLERLETAWALLTKSQNS